MLHYMKTNISLPFSDSLHLYMTSAFIELSDFWISITRKGDYPRGVGKWMLFTANPYQLYEILKEGMKQGKLESAYSVKTKAEQPEEGGSVYVHTGPYNDQDLVLRLVNELQDVIQGHDFQLTGPLLFKSDMHNTWCETLSRPGDGYHELLKRNWLYKYEDGKLVVNAVIHALHQALEEPPDNADPEFLIIQSMLPVELFAGEKER